MPLVVDNCDVIEGSSTGKWDDIVLVVTTKSLTVNSQEAIESTSTVETVGIVPVDFPFRNRSFPRDDDSDILPYPENVDRKTSSRKQNTKFFLLTSKEAYD